MFNHERLKDILAKYKRDFPAKWPDEKFKWEAVKCFQTNWDIEAVDFSNMLSRSLAKTYNLLAAKNHFPAGMITEFAQAYPEKVQRMFVELFDESHDLYARISGFKQQADKLLMNYSGEASQHFQTENSISVYLWLRYPDKYYIYKFSEIKSAANKLEFTSTFKKGAYKENIELYLDFCDEICDCLKQDNELVQLFRTNLTGSCYPDPEMRTLTVDVIFYISRFIGRDSDHNHSLTVSDLDNQEFDVAQLHSEARYKKWFKPLVDALISLGGSASRPDVHERVIALCGISDEDVAKQNKSGQSIILNDVDWARNYLNYEGFLEKDVPKGIWQLTNIGKKIIMTDELAGKIIAKWIRIKTAKRKNLPIPEIDLTQYYTYRDDIKKYTKADFLSDVYLSAEDYDGLAAVLERKKNIILKGAPGVGKTYAAKRLAYAMMGEKDDNRIKLVQFHQSYSYEDFVIGYRPTETGFKLTPGVFLRFSEAARQSEKKHFFIIDEINRGNTSKIFGELLMLIEKDYRAESVTLPYDDRQFTIPDNVYIIGMMNTADRSLAMIDYALRRRFSFFEMRPAFASEGFSIYQSSLKNDKLDALIEKVQALNEEISCDASLGKGFAIGHSYFCGAAECTDDWLRSIVEYDIIPMLAEYWFDDEDKLRHWENILRGAIK